jgi:hypothetical protein
MYVSFSSHRGIEPFIDGSNSAQLGFAKSTPIRLKGAFVPISGSNYVQSGDHRSVLTFSIQVNSASESQLNGIKINHFTLIDRAFNTIS